MTTGEVRRERVPLDTADVGAELLDILSRGLYTDPFDAVREYVQNAVDAGAREIIITHTGTALLIRDNGSGMGWDDLKNARRFGVSVKDTTKDIGFRGIGIYSSYGIAGKLRFECLGNLLVMTKLAWRLTSPLSNAALTIIVKPKGGA